jgi:nicotinamidase/pyrazinamidase
MPESVSPTALVVVDCQYDFVEGSLACQHSHEAVDFIIDYINEHPDLQVCYSADWHSPENHSFREHGGTWPPHCVQKTPGAELDKNFERKISSERKKPNSQNIFYKGVDDLVEEYSAFEAKNASGKVLHELLPHDVIVAGIASEFCVRETVLALDKAGFNVSLLSPGLAFVDPDQHQENLADLRRNGITIIGEEQ